MRLMGTIKCITTAKMMKPFKKAGDGSFRIMDSNAGCSIPLRDYGKLDKG